MKWHASIMMLTQQKRGMHLVLLLEMLYHDAETAEARHAPGAAS